jgi:hypothetical protein
MRDDLGFNLNNVKAAAAQSGAYGGARQGLVEAELMDDYSRNVAEAVGSMAHQGFNTAAQFGQNRLQQILTAAGQASAQGADAYGIGQQALAGQMQAGTQQQMLMQRLMDIVGQQYDTYANYPQQALATAMAGVAGNPLANAGNRSTTESYNAGLYDQLAFASGLLGGGN